MAKITRDRQSATTSAYYQVLFGNNSGAPTSGTLCLKVKESSLLVRMHF